MPIIMLSPHNRLSDSGAPPPEDNLIFSEDFEASLPGNFDSQTGSPTRQSSIVAQGTWAVSTDAVEYFTEQFPSQYTELWIDFYFRLGTQTGSTHQLLKLGENGGSDQLWLSILNTEELRITDGTNTNNTGITLSAGAWYSVFLHFKLGVSGAEVVEAAANQTGTISGFTYSNTSATILQDNFDKLFYGRCSAPSGETFYFDKVRVYEQSTMPEAWQ